MSVIRTVTDLGKQMTTKANGTANVISTSFKEGFDSLEKTASSMADEFNEKAVRASTAQMCRMLEIAAEEIKAKTLSAQSVSLTASLNIGIATLRMQVHLQPAGTENSGEVVALPKTA